MGVSSARTDTTPAPRAGSRVGSGVRSALDATRLVATVYALVGCAGMTVPSVDGGPGPTRAGGLPGSATQSAPVDGGDAASGPGCPETPAAHAVGATIVAFPTTPFVGGRPMVYGQPNSLSGGGTLTPLNLRFFVSGVSLVRADATSQAVDLVTADGTLEPYGVHLFNAEDPASTTWRIRAVPGSYTGMIFLLGLTDACNALAPGASGALSTTSQLSWPPPFGFLFLRFEARIEAPDGGWLVGPDGGAAARPLDAIAMGGLVGFLLAPTVHVGGPLDVPGPLPASPPAVVERPLRLDMDQVFEGATANVDVSHAIPAPPGGGGPFGPPGGDEVLAGERLRQTAPGLPLFVLDP
jgi:hypothetical protein